MVEKNQMPPTDTPVPPMLANVLRITPARLWRRALSLLLDTLLGGLIAMVILTTSILPQHYPNYEKVIFDQWQAVDEKIQEAMAGAQFSPPNISDDFTEVSATIYLTTFAVLLVYFTASEVFSGGTTLGKRVFGLRTARWGTAEPPLGIESLSRCIFKAASLVWLWPLLLLANAMPTLFRSTRRAGHDYLARTIVTGDPPPAPARGRFDRDEDN